MSGKIKPQHLARKAILYIRQSSSYQACHNLESQKEQYAMEERLRQLGWREIEVVDEDLGRSAAGMVARAGFERMVAQVCLGNVGAVAAREVSRFACNSREWPQLVEVCRVVDTVLIDQEMVYSPRQSNVVADELERRWNQRLQRVKEIELRIEQHTHTQGEVANTPRVSREEFESLAADLELVWNHGDGRSLEKAYRPNADSLRW